MCKNLINDPRLTPTMSRVRSGSNQVFTEGDIKVELKHDKKEMFAELIDGDWYWVSGCGPCNGKERGYHTYIECDDHDRCRSCGIKSKDYEGTRWGGSGGWACDTCSDAERFLEKKKAFDMLEGEEPDCTYRDKIVCAHCGSTISSNDIYESQEIECGVCEGEMSLEVEWTASYSTIAKGDRITL